ncbi:winged helix-turn-helix domain-containing protein [Halorubrum ezzemoulense]|uniref:Winged helix-turn-helix domain-containing protein n=1 Tax=Halorubrum ezzemoulense TaxID=337243 RepID=A0ABT4Z8I9_HALEZ|nr:winged helix-turn-helix domain-containing protein [Halorubrum ezzemoulense]MDB2246160.1 winged helix-turn-helix domain-containing protein [Halorubrum ezzemoulense]MDB2275467.1 winged helix-turn-helix domain-containing protein [Halorubrum ezzemoulense]MDB2279808.1 winged helix-turn-helix domain-containing protein [Halorubrum ezzemoulense]MDB2290234.1 winged helix-turn-helix domain-containing protein [Halorubrum ezzemoulense]MDB2294404.1 winged helix-turn-helix domain-containing protein [Halo
MSTDHRADELLDLLGEERVRQILAATSRDPLSAKELSEECDVALSTIYRRVEDMVANDLLVEQTQIETDGSHHSVYEANVDHVDVDIEDGTIDIKMDIREDAAQRFSRIWSDIRDT